MLITITLRRSGPHPDTTMEIETSSTISQFKDQLQQSGMASPPFRLIHAGVILHDEFDLNHYQVIEGSVIHLIQSPPQRAVEPALQTSESSMFQDLSSNPAVRRLAENPELMRAMILANPQVREVVEKNPEYGQILSDPNFLRQGFEMARNPDKMREVLRNNDRAISNLEMLPGGFNHLKKIYQSLQEPMENAQRGSDSSSAAANRRFAEMYGVKINNENRVNNEPLPNPWAPPPQDRRTRSSNSMTGGSDFLSSGFPASQVSRRWRPSRPADSGSGTISNDSAMMEDVYERFRSVALGANVNSDSSAAPPSSAPEQAPASEPTEAELAERYSLQIERLNEMGFDNLVDNLRALQASGGDVDDAVEWLLQLQI